MMLFGLVILTALLMLLLLCCCYSALLSAALRIVVVRLRLGLAWWDDGSGVRWGNYPLPSWKGREGDRAARHNLIEAAHTSYFVVVVVVVFVVVVSLVTADNTNTHT